MKKLLTYLIILIVVTGTCLLAGYYYYGIFTPYNYFTAKEDLKEGVVQIISYGELRKNEQMESEIAIKYGFQQAGIGCAVNTPVINGISKYNDVIYRYLDKLNGDDWEIKYQKERSDNNLNW